MYDCIIIGSGPAGYTAGIYCIRSGLKTLLLEGTSVGGQLMYTTDVENFPGFPTGINGYDLMMNMRLQCKNLGCELLELDAQSINFSIENNHQVVTKEFIYDTKTIIIATGATAKKLGIINEDLYWNNGISACAVCDGALPIFRNQPLAVVGGGDTACEEALFLSRFASKVHMLIRTDKMKASHIMRNKVLNNTKIEILYNTKVISADGINNKLNSINVIKDDTTYDIEVAGLFYAIGHEPNTKFLNGLLETDKVGYLTTNNTCTSIPGIFACGDVQDKIYRQAITAAGSGCIAALEVEKYLTK